MKGVLYSPRRNNLKLSQQGTGRLDLEATTPGCTTPQAARTLVRFLVLEDKCDHGSAEQGYTVA